MFPYTRWPASQLSPSFVSAAVRLATATLTLIVFSIASVGYAEAANESTMASAKPCRVTLDEIQSAWPWQDRIIGVRDRSMIEVQLGMAKYLCSQGRDAEAAAYINFVQGMLSTRGLGGR